MSRRMLALFALLAVALAVLATLALQRGVLGPQPQTAAVGGPFKLVDTAGRPVDESLLKGKWSAVFFGFTYCPDACPTTLFAMGQAEKLLGDKAKDLQTVFISVDPDRDTAEQIAAYLDNDAFPQKVVGLTGSHDQVGVAARAYRAYYRKSGEGPDYVVDHSTITYLMTPRGQFACVIAYGSTPEQIAQKITSAMKLGARAQAC